MIRARRNHNTGGTVADKKIYTQQELNDSTIATVRRIIPFADDIVENMRMVAAGRRDQSRLDKAIEEWEERTKGWRE